MAAWWHDHVRRSEETAAKSRETWVKELRNEWGRDFDRHAREARRAVKNLAPEGFARFLDQTGLGDHPAMARLFLHLGRRLGEDALVDGANAAPATIPRTEGGTPLLRFPSMERG